MEAIRQWMDRSPAPARLGTTWMLLAACGACSGAADTLALAEATDSAGVRMVMTAGTPPSVAVGLDAPLLVLTGEEGGAPPVFEVEGGFLVDDGGFVLADAGNHVVRRYDPDGTLAWTRGREGDGPGEFRGMRWIEARAGGGLHVGDPAARRVTAMGPDGALLWERPFHPGFDEAGLPNDAIIAPQPLALTASGAGDVVGFPAAVALPRGQRGPLPVQAELALYPVATAGDGGAVPLGRVAVITWYEDPGREGFPLANALGGARMWWGGHSGRFAVTSSTSPEIRVFDRGRLAMIVREDRPREPFRPDSLPSGFDVAFDSLPSYHDLRVDGLHRVWARLTGPDRAGPATWRVFGPTGAVAMDVLLPPDTRVLDASVERLLVLRHDELEVERVELHPAPELPGG